MDKKNRKQEVLQSVLARFSRILDDIDHSAHAKYKKKLQESGVASSIQIGMSTLFHTTKLRGNCLLNAIGVK